MKIDLHIHTNFSSCSHMSIDEVIEYAHAAGLDGIGITDHNTMNSKNHIHEGRQDNGLYIFIGMEYTTPEGDFLLFGPFQSVPTKMSASSLMMWIKNQKGVAIAAHPFRANRHTRDSIFKKGLCNIAEGLNGRNSDLENLKAGNLQEKYQIQFTGGSDAHEVYEIGKIYTLFQSPIGSTTELVHALNTGLYRPEINLNHPILSKSPSACLSSP